MLSARITELLELMIGCNLTRLIQVGDHTISITIANPAAAQTDTITINGIACSFTSDATPTKQEVSDGLIAAIEASAQADNVIVTQGATPDFDITIVTANALDPTITVSANLADAETVGEAIICPTRCRLLGFILDSDLTGGMTIKDGTDTKLVFSAGVVGGQTVDVRGLFSTDLRFSLDAAADSGAVMWMGGD